MRHILAALIIATLLVFDLAPAPVIAQEVRAQGEIVVAQAQQPQRRRTLFDMLFGDEEAQQPQVQQQQPRQQPQQQQSRQQPAAQPRAAAPRVAEPAVPPPPPRPDKAEDATRLAVFGDSMATDLARALERYYAEDPNLVVLSEAVGSSGFVRDDFFNWNAAATEKIAEDSFDLAVIIIGINDRQNLEVAGQSERPLTDAWTSAYTARLNDFLAQMRAANKPVIWVGLPPMERADYSTAISQINAIQRLASFSGGAEFVDVFERFLDENGRYSAFGPDLNGQRVLLRKDDGIHFSAEGADKVVYYVGQAIRQYYRGGRVATQVADALLGSDGAAMVRPPYQGLGQTRLLEVAGAVVSLSASSARAGDMVLAGDVPANGPGFELESLTRAPAGRADAFGVGLVPDAEAEPDPAAETAALFAP